MFKIMDLWKIPLRRAWNRIMGFANVKVFGSVGGGSLGLQGLGPI